MFEETFFDTGELKLRVMRSKENKSPLLLLHGLGASWRVFEQMMADLAPDWDIYAHDHRGHGKSDRAETYRIVDYANDAIELIKSEMEEPVTLIGHSLGGMAALITAAKIPDRIRTVIIEDSPLPFYKTKNEFIEKENLKGLITGLEQSIGSGMHLMTKEELTEIVSPQLPDAPEEFIQLYVKIIMQFDINASKSIVNDFENVMKEYFHEQIYPKITCPVLLLQGDTSLGALMIDEDLEKTMDQLKNATHHKFAKTTHLMHFENYKPIFEVISKHLKTI